MLLIVEFISACSYTSYGYRWRIGDVYISSAIESFVLMLAIGWLAFRSDRWWPFLATASLALTLMVHGLTVVTDIPWDAAVSARVGFNILLNVSLLAGVAERWLAGERAAGDRQMWRRRRPPAARAGPCRATADPDRRSRRGLAGWRAP